ncbi:hypothetical protein PG993_008987 [Apiospora rasikravindrae]|uniref:Heterokaryon incompatibility domain-containing protein n=1 Tax=Apiospora rasikravindrae TaxID=990691 RepID=A0ABR1SI51_9PEZI
MRLIETTKLELVEFTEELVPKYAILSHRWEEDEVTLQEMQAVGRKKRFEAVSQTVNAVRSKKGYTKIKRSAALALEHGFAFIWIDTCCIDKTSSAELSEAINSMYRWYQNAAVCIAFLSDAHDDDAMRNVNSFHDVCHQSLWFTRGWTLQELVAPAEVIFYGSDWKYLGSKEHDEEVRHSLHKTTGINIRVLDGSMQVSGVSVAERMKWASKRRTSRAEDMAYSLLGIFDVNMPLLYGEGGVKAFIRLQEEILRTSNDQTIFTWRVPEMGMGHKEYLWGLLAKHPRYFEDVENYRPLPPVVSKPSTAWSSTNQGMRLTLLLQPRSGFNESTYLAILECSRRQAGDFHWSPAVRVRRLYGDQFARTQAHLIDTVPTPLFEQQSEAGVYETVFIKQTPVYPIPDFMVSFDNLRWRGTSSPLTWPAQVYPPSSWDSESGVLLSKMADYQTPVGLIRFTSVSLEPCLDLVVGLEQQPGGAWKPWALQRLVPRDTTVRQSFHEVNSLDRLSFFKEDPNLFYWQPALKGPVQIKVHEQKVHGRTSFLIKALTSLELPEQTIDPPLPFLITTVRPVPVLQLAKIGPDLQFKLQNILEDFVFQDSMDSWSPIRFLTAQQLVRTYSGPNMAERLRRQLEEQPIGGLTETSTTFLQFCEGGNLPGVLAMLKDDPSLARSASADFYKLHAIHWAAAGGHTTIIEQLLYAGVSPGSRNGQGLIPMHFAALFGRFQALNWLIRYEIGDFTRSLDMSQLLGERKNMLQESPLHFALSQVWAAEDEDELDALVELADCLKTWGLANLQNRCSETPLHRLAACGLSTSAMKRGLGDLFNHERNAARAINYIDETGYALPRPQLDKMGRTLLWHATVGGRVEEVRLLLQGKYPAVNTGDTNGIFPLHIACRYGHAEVARALLEAGAWADCVTAEPGLTPAHYAALFNHVECLKALVEYGADVQQATESDEFRCKPIHFANVNKYSDIRRILVEAGSDENDMHCTHYVVRRSQATEIPKHPAQVVASTCDERADKYIEACFSQTLFEVMYASSPAGRSLLSESVKVARRPPKLKPMIQDEIVHDPSPVSSEDEDEDELFHPPRKDPVVSRTGLVDSVIGQARKTMVGEEPTAGHAIPSRPPAGDTTTRNESAKNEPDPIPVEDMVPQIIPHILVEGEPATFSLPPRRAPAETEEPGDGIRNEGHEMPENEAPLQEERPTAPTVCFELEGDKPAGSGNTTDEASNEDGKILATILPPQKKDHIVLEDGLYRYFKLAIDISEWKGRGGDDRSGEECKMMEDDIDPQEDAATMFNAEPTTNDEDSATHYRLISRSFAGDQTAREASSENWMTDVVVTSQDVHGRIALGRRLEMREDSTWDSMSEISGRHDGRRI